MKRFAVFMLAMVFYCAMAGLVFAATTVYQPQGQEVALMNFHSGTVGDIQINATSGANIAPMTDLQCALQTARSTADSKRAPVVCEGQDTINTSNTSFSTMNSPAITTTFNAPNSWAIMVAASDNDNTPHAYPFHLRL